MAQNIVIAIKGLEELQGALEDLPKNIRVAAKLAVNSTLRKTRSSSAKQIAAQVAFGNNYLDQPGRLEISQFASAENLTGRIKARDRATSLARFATQAGRGVSIEVKPGVTKRSRRAFFMKLKSGTADIETKFNLGLAIRLRPGERVQSKTNMVRVQPGVYVLYGPSVAQVFADVGNAEAPGAAEYMEREFLRLMEL